MPYLKPKRIVVTGGAGFLGKSVVAKLGSMAEKISLSREFLYVQDATLSDHACG